MHIKEFVEQNKNDLPQHTQKSMDRFLNFIYDRRICGDLCMLCMCIKIIIMSMLIFLLC
jgi:hypothetical protein